MGLLDNDHKSQYIICKIDGKNIQASAGESLLQVCFKAYIDIPRFCYHEGLQIAGNCRMCLVEVENSKKLVASCATPVVDGLSVFTKTFRIKKARQAVLEFLLINHPLDCPICDQGGECDLQDITLIFGSDRGRFYEMSKRAVIDKNLGPLIKTIMNRCIHCTRCVRFFKEVSTDFDKSISALGVLGRGSRMEIGTYISTNLLHELSGNIIDLCPVGALTSKPFAFKARSWELISQYNFDVVDSFMPRIKMDLSGVEVLRVLPYMDEYGHGWISNKTRFFFDSLNQTEITSCFWHYDVMLNEFLRLIPHSFYNHLNLVFYIRITWKDAFRLFLIYFQNALNYPITTKFSSMLSVNQVWELKKFLLSTGNGFFKKNLFKNNLVDFRNFFTIDLSLDYLDNGLWVLLLLGVNLRMESPLLFLHIKRLASKGRLHIITALNINLIQENINNLSLTLNDLISFLEGRSKYNRILLKKLVFHRFLVLANQEISTSTNFKPMLLILKQIFTRYRSLFCKTAFLPSLNNSFFFSISVLQRYVGNISLSEMGLYGLKSNVYENQYKKSNVNRLTLSLDVIENENVKYCNRNSNASNILFIQTTNINQILKQSHSNLRYSLVLPFKPLYVEENEIFFDIFLKQKSIVNVKPMNLNEKSFSDLLRTFSTFIFKRSSFFFFHSSYLIPIKWTWMEGLGLSYSKGKKDLTFAHKGTSITKEFFEQDFQKESFFFISYNIYRFYHLKQLGIKPLLNFYKDSKLNLVCFSNTLKRSSLVFKKNNQYDSFGLFTF